MLQKRSVVAANINYYRTLLNVSQKELYGALGISRNTYRRRCDLETFTVADLRIIANILHRQVIDLVKGA